MNIATNNEFSNKIIGLIEKSKKDIVQVINSQMVMTYWNIGKEIFLEEQNGQDGAECGKVFSSSNLRRMRQFYSIFSDEKICATVSHKFSWSHFVEFININLKALRCFFYFQKIIYLIGK